MLEEIKFGTENTKRGGQVASTIDPKYWKKMADNYTSLLLLFLGVSEMGM
jgi:hypothetical protein